MKQQPAKVCQGGDPTSLVKMKMREEQTGGAELLLLLEGDRDFQEDDIPPATGILVVRMGGLLWISSQLLSPNLTVICFEERLYCLALTSSGERSVVTCLAKFGLPWPRRGSSVTMGARK
jgi:hypothetical protein